MIEDKPAVGVGRDFTLRDRGRNPAVAMPFDGEELDLVYLCAGKGTRVGLEVPKQFVDLKGKPVMCYSLEAFNQMPFVARKIIVHDPCEKDRIAAVLEKYHIANCALVAGGATRQESVRLGLAQARTSRVLTHNAAVAFVTTEMVEKVMAIEADCVSTATELKVNPLQLDRGALRPIDRRTLRIVNSPQVFRTGVFREAHRLAWEKHRAFDSDAELMLHFGHSVELVNGPAWSFKITDRLDLALAEAILAQHDVFTDVARP